MKRRRFTERQTLECAINQGAVIPCFRCGTPFTVETIKTAEREHIHEFVLGGPDTVDACAYSCQPCHSLVTNGNGATSAGSSKHKAAKIRPKRTQKFVVEKPALRSAAERQMKHGAGFRLREIPSRKFPTQQRGFAPRGSRPMNKKRRA